MLKGNGVLMYFLPYGDDHYSRAVAMVESCFISDKKTMEIPGRDINA
ncbi:hypothetical protein PQQ51_03605 [Paraburkholderia xenovorans]